MKPENILFGDEGVLKVPNSAMLAAGIGQRPTRERAVEPAPEARGDATLASDDADVDGDGQGPT